MWWIILLVPAAIVAAIFIYLRVAGHGSFPWIQFYTKGKESGFSFREVGLLRKIAVETEIENPTALFWSIKQLNRSIKEMIIKLRSQDMIDDEESNRLLSKLYDLRKRVEFDLPRYRLGLKSSRDITPRQRMRVTLPGAGPFATMAIENRPKYLALSRPQGPGLPEGFMWKGQQIGLHFWRAEDAGYFMRTKVINDFINQKYPIIHVAHADEIARTQQRRSIRVKTNFQATVYPLKNIQDANELEETAKGLRCRLLDLSEDGACLMVGGRTKAGLPIKIQFELAGRLVVMCGLVKGVSYDQRKNFSLLHVQAVPLSMRTRNYVLTYVYNIFGEQEPEKVQSKPTL
ncbi:MAG: PilZ domain-containing protein [Spirochaetaceae bacterium]|nr:MAG: PilZ domain-containing protein [Spirochaetaceae bacterium]